MSRTWDYAMSAGKTGTIAGALLGGVLGLIAPIPGGMIMGAIGGASKAGIFAAIAGGVYGAVTKDPLVKTHKVIVVPARNASAYYVEQDMTPDLSSTRFQDMAAQRASQEVVR
jgi:outer membrane lipoprotein SlyB